MPRSSPSRDKPATAPYTTAPLPERTTPPPPTPRARPGSSSGSSTASSTAEPLNRPARPATNPDGTARRTRALKGCDKCARAKRKCEAGIPCRRCEMKGMECTFNGAGDTAPPSSPTPARAAFGSMALAVGRATTTETLAPEELVAFYSQPDLGNAGSSAHSSAGPSCNAAPLLAHDAAAGPSSQPAPLDSAAASASELPTPPPAAESAREEPLSPWLAAALAMQPDPAVADPNPDPIDWALLDAIAREGPVDVGDLPLPPLPSPAPVQGAGDAVDTWSEEYIAQLLALGWTDQVEAGPSVPRALAASAAPTPVIPAPCARPSAPAPRPAARAAPSPIMPVARSPAPSAGCGAQEDELARILGLSGTFGASDFGDPCWT